MADHGEVQYSTAEGNDYREHEGTYSRFLDLAFSLSAYVIATVIGLATVHRTSMSRSFAAVAVPAVACCGFVTLVALMAGVASLIGQWH